MGQKSTKFKPQCTDTTNCAPSSKQLNSYDKTIYNLIHDTQFTVDTMTVTLNCNCLLHALSNHNINMQSICCGEYIFIIILLEFLNQSIILGRTLQAQLQIVIDIFNMHQLIFTQPSNTSNIQHQIVLENFYGHSILQYSSISNSNSNFNSKLFITLLNDLKSNDMLLNVVHPKCNLVLNSFINELIKCIQVQPSASMPSAYPLPSAPPALNDEDPLF